jgi:hypothetical protein
MTLAQLLTSPPPPYDELRRQWLVFDAALAAKLDAVQDPTYQHQARPVQLTDGRLAICADALTEINGLLAEPFSKLDASNFAAVEVIDDAAFRQLLPPPPAP